jgi:hypothetical protein
MLSLMRPNPKAHLDTRSLSPSRHTAGRPHKRVCSKAHRNHRLHVLPTVTERPGADLAEIGGGWVGQSSRRPDGQSRAVAVHAAAWEQLYRTGP